VTIDVNQLIPGEVFDGDLAGVDLPILTSKSKVTVNWSGFGAGNSVGQVDNLSGNTRIAINYCIFVLCISIINTLEPVSVGGRTVPDHLF
jgi:hypothetical protein